MAVFNVTQLVSKGTCNGLRAFLNTHKLQVLFSNSTWRFCILGDHDMNRSRLPLAVKRIDEILGNTPILTLEKCPRLDLTDVVQKREARRLARA